MSEVLEAMDRAEAHLASGELEALLLDLAELVKCSSHEVVISERWEKLRGRLVLGLFEGLPFGRFLQMPYAHPMLSESEVYKAVEHRLDVSRGMQLVDRFGALPYLGGPLCERLRQEPGEAVSRWLQGWIERLSSRPGRDSPCETDIAEFFEVLMARADPLARKLTEVYLREPPWGVAGQPTAAVLNALTVIAAEELAYWRDEQARESLLQALEAVPDRPTRVQGLRHLELLQDVYRREPSTAVERALLGVLAAGQTAEMRDEDQDFRSQIQ